MDVYTDVGVVQQPHGKPEAGNMDELNVSGSETIARVKIPRRLGAGGQN
jgi:hypothetical protein